MPGAKWFSGIVVAAIAVWMTGTGAPYAASQQVLSRLRLSAPVGAATISPDGRLVAAIIGRSVQQESGNWINSESVDVFDPPLSKVTANITIPVQRITEDPPLFNNFIRYCDSGRYLAIYDGFRTVYVVDSTSYRAGRSISLEQLPTRGGLGSRRIVCSSQAPILVVNDAGGNYGWGHLAVYDLASGKLLSEVRQNGQSGAEFGPIAVAPNGRELAILLTSPRWKLIKGPDIEIRNTANLESANYITTRDMPSDVAFVGNSEIVTVHGDGAGDPRPSKHFLRLWDIGKGKELRRFSDPHFATVGPVNASADGQKLIASIVGYRVCRLCDGLEGRVDVKEQRFAIWDTYTGTQVFRSQPYSPIIEPVGAQCVLAEDGNAVLIMWPHSEITPRVVPVPDH